MHRLTPDYELDRLLDRLSGYADPRSQNTEQNTHGPSVGRVWTNSGVFTGCASMNEYQCPVEGCNAAFDSVGSVKGHISRKADASHSGLSGPDYWEKHGEEPQTAEKDTSEQQPEPENTDGLDFPENPDYEPEEESTDGACSHGAVMMVEPGHEFTTEDGRKGITESGDQYCNDCGAIIAADGEIYE